MHVCHLQSGYIRYMVAWSDCSSGWLCATGHGSAVRSVVMGYDGKRTDGCVDIWIPLVVLSAEMVMDHVPKTICIIFVVMQF